MASHFNTIYTATLAGQENSSYVNLQIQIFHHSLFHTFSLLVLG